MDGVAFQFRWVGGVSSMQRVSVKIVTMCLLPPLEGICFSVVFLLFY